MPWVASTNIQSIGIAGRSFQAESIGGTSVFDIDIPLSREDADALASHGLRPASPAEIAALGEPQPKASEIVSNPVSKGTPPADPPKEQPKEPDPPPKLDDMTEEQLLEVGRAIEFKVDKRWNLQRTRDELRAAALEKGIVLA